MTILINKEGLRSWFVLFIAVLLLSLSGIFTWLHITSPSDGARLPPGETGPINGGIQLVPIEPSNSLIQPDDLLIAVDGRSLREWSQSILTFGKPPLPWDFGDTVSYTILRDARRLEIPVTLSRYPIAAVLRQDGSTILFIFTSFLTAAIVFAKRPGLPSARALFLAGAGGLASSVWAFGLTVNDFLGGIGARLYLGGTLIGYMLLWIAGAHFALVFPKPHRLLTSRPWLIPTLYLLPYLGEGCYAILLWQKLHDPLAWYFGLYAGGGPVQLIYLLILVLAMVSNFRLSRDAASRQQARWVVYAVTLVGTVTILFAMIPETLTGQPILSWNSVSFLGLLVPVAIAIAILRHQLFDIDLVINRTLVYGLLTGMLALVYFLGVVLLQQIFPVESDISIALSSLASVALFSPLRGRIQTLIDRRFYRRKYNVEVIIAAFGAHLRTQVDPERLTDDLVTVVDKTVQPDHISLWLRDPGKAARLEPGHGN